MLRCVFQRFLDCFFFMKIFEDFWVHFFTRIRLVAKFSNKIRLITVLELQLVNSQLMLRVLALPWLLNTVTSCNRNDQNGESSAGANKSSSSKSVAAAVFLKNTVKSSRKWQIRCQLDFRKNWLSEAKSRKRSSASKNRTKIFWHEDSLRALYFVSFSPDKSAG